MKTFINKIFIFVGILAVLILIIAMLPIEQDNYLQAYNKKCKLLEITPSPRIIFVGGSNLSFGLDSQRIKDSLDINVINFGLHAGIGLKYMIDDISIYARKGDIIVFAPEYQHFYSGAYGESETIAPLMAVAHWRKVHLLDMRQWINVVTGLPQIPKSSSLMPPNRTSQSYKASGFNEYGDETQHWAFKGARINAKPFKGTFNKQFCKYFISKIINLQKKCSVFIIPPIYTESAYNINQNDIAIIEEFLEKEGCPFLVSPKAHVLRDEYAYDSEYHMNRQGVDEYTSFIIGELKPFFSDKDK